MRALILIDLEEEWRTEFDAQDAEVEPLAGQKLLPHHQTSSAAYDRYQESEAGDRDRVGHRARHQLPHPAW